MSTLQLKKVYNELPANVKRFALRGSLLLTGWLVVYHLYLQPNGTLDNVLTYWVQWGTAQLLQFIYPNVHLVPPSIFRGSEYVITITAPCNGLELFVLFIGFMLCVPTNAKRFWTFTFLGSAIIHVMNLFRCLGLALLNIHHSAFTDFAHHYAFKLALYMIIFIMWSFYIKKEKNHEATA